MGSERLKVRMNLNLMTMAKVASPAMVPIVPLHRGTGLASLDPEAPHGACCEGSTGECKANL